MSILNPINQRKETMSHFSVLVIGNDFDTQLQPYHEFECTGTDDEFVQDVDITSKVREVYAKSLETMGENEALQDALGDFGLEDRCIEDGETPDTDERHKYGYAILKHGELVKAINRTNPNKKWDWWAIGGRWSGYLKLKSGGEVNQARIIDVDVDGMRDGDGARAAAVYDLMLDLTDGIGLPPISETWESLCKDQALSWEERRERFHKQPATVAFGQLRTKAHAFGQDNPDQEHTSGRIAWADGPDEFCVSKDAYVQSARDRAMTTFALVKDGKWFEKGKMGWWACVANEKEQSDWNKEFAALLDGLAPETLITVVDCHI